jgi:hypothetical protein
VTDVVTVRAQKGNPTSAPLVRKEVQVILTFGTGPRGDGPGESIVLTGHRISASVNVAGGVGMGQATVRIWGMTFDLMNKCSTIGIKPQAVRRNSVVIAAGDAEVGMSTIFEGTVTAAWADFTGAPEVVFQLVAAAGMIEAVTQPPPMSRKGPVKAETILAELAAKAGLKFDNSAQATRTLPNTMLTGSLRNQIMTCADAARFAWLIDRRRLIIWPREGVRPADSVPLISAETGMVGYPSYTAIGVMVTCQFNPEIDFGALVEVRSTLRSLSGTTSINGRWQSYSLVHEVEAEVPGGKWFTQAMLTEPGNLVVKS